MPLENGVLQRAVICQDCWFWKEMNCALASPESNVCANKRPVMGRLAAPSGEPVVATQPAAATVATQPTPFATSDPEATFSMTQLREAVTPIPAPRVQQQLELVDGEIPLIPSFRDIRAGRVPASAQRSSLRAAAATQAPTSVAITIPIDEVEPVMSEQAPAHRANSVLPCMEQLAERVRRRTAERLARSMSAANPA